MVTVMGQYPLDYTWNGWLTPRMDPHAVETVMHSFAKAAEEEPALPNSYSHRWEDDGTLVVTETFDEEEWVDVIEPDEDGLYDLGSHSWTWSVDYDPTTAWVNGLPYPKED